MSDIRSPPLELSDPPPLTVRSAGSRVPLSHAQEGLWFLEQLGLVGAAYNMPWMLQLEGALDALALEQSFGEVVRRHESLRTRFETVDGRGFQVVDEAGAFRLDTVDLSALGDDERRAETGRLMSEDGQRLFDLSAGPLFRVTLLRLTQNQHIVLVNMHHIISDAWSIGVMLAEVTALYAARVAGRVSPLESLQVQYADYALWQRQWLRGEVQTRQLDYWKRQLADAPQALALPTDRARPQIQSFRGASRGFSLTPQLSSDLRVLARQEKATPYMVFLAAFSVLLARYSGQRDILIGSPFAGRGLPELEAMVGCFVNMLVMRTDVSDDPSFRDLLQRVKETTLSAYENQDVPLERVVEALQPHRDLSRQPLFQVALILLNGPPAQLDLPGLRVSQVATEHVTTRFDLSLTLYEASSGIRGWFEYASDLFDDDTIARIAGHFENLLSAIAAGPDKHVSELKLLDALEHGHLITEWNATTVDYPAEKCVGELFVEQVGRTPHAVAVVGGAHELTYRELNVRSNRLAHHLRGLGVKPDDRVAICALRGVEMLVALLAVLKAGGAYVPMDSTLPIRRLADMLADCAPRAILSDAETMGILEGHTGDLPVIDLDNEALWTNGHESNIRPAAVGLRPENLAYVIYTSGSTGRPKGVMVEHRSLVNLLTSMSELVGMNPADRLLSVTTVAFDIAGLELLMPLLVGARVVIADRKTSSDPRRMMDLLLREQITVLQATPASWRALIESGWVGEPRLRALCGGEAMTADLADQLLRRTSACWNVYGPTETTIWSSAHAIKEPVHPSTVVPIGRPISNTRIYVLDEHRAPVPIGVVGEIYIAGTGVARGYLNRPELTVERFVTEPFATDPDARMYRTGDLGRLLSAGSIEYLGRNDFQVKLRGYRIELGEIEAALMGHASVRQAVVVAREDRADDPRLVAYVVENRGTSVKRRGGRESRSTATGTLSDDLRTHLQKHLPDYMVPSTFVVLDALPLTLNGKLDRGSLPAPSGHSRRSRAYEPPRGRLEKMLAQTWSEFLEIDRVGRDDNFFELGGHSLLAVRLVNELSRRGTDISLAKLFASPTIALLVREEAGTDNRASDGAAITLRAEGSGAPLFLAPDLFNQMVYGPILTRHLRGGFPVYGLTMSEVGAASARTIEAIGRSLVRTIRSIRPSGPYRLAGWSFGGILAYEITRQLVDENETVQFLGLIDALYGQPSSPSKTSDVVFLRNYIGSRTGGRMHQSDFRSMVLECREKALLPWSSTEEDVRLMIAQSRTRERAGSRYVGAAIPIALQLFTAAENPLDDRFYGWDRVVQAPRIHKTVVQGTHHSMLQSPYVASLGKVFSEAILLPAG
ncbi:non-ribosomal peptide synthetase [Bradyrhizobium sp. UNPF46]|uniref:non-ribosomal peptide synthetase n=1 Tax=Bradyrhizobium sp. UNPF46 TaxID=1141168 RepID=UPI00114FB09F|nr:non-ribosomal peptide synthetase [Bradyrhizobium sp. UNPF46]